MVVIEYLTQEQEHLVIQFLITLVQNAPELYVKSFENYKNSEKRLQKFQEFVPIISRNVKINAGSDLMKLWNALVSKFSSIKTSIRKTPRHSGTGAGHEESNLASKWPYYNQLQFLTPYTSPPEIKSSRDLRETAKSSSSTSTPIMVPEYASFAKRRRTQIDKVDEEIINTSKKIQKSLEKLLDDDLPPKKASKRQLKNSTLTNACQENGYCAAVVQSYRDLSSDKKFEGFVAIMNEIKELKLNSI